MQQSAELTLRLFRVWLLGFAGFFLAIGAWSVASPPDAGPDEYAHLLRAYAVANGDVFLEPEDAILGTGAFHSVPTSLTRLDGDCYKAKANVSAACLPDPGADRTPVRVADTAGRYNPIYYGLVGWPLKLWPDMTGLIAARLVSAAICAALLAAAMASVLRHAEQRLMLGALLLGVTPMAVHIGSLINPNGVEIAAGIAFFAAGIPVLLRPGDERPPAWLLWTLTVSAVILVTVRSGGPLWLLIGGLALILPLRPARIRELVLRRSLRWVYVVVAVASVASVAWIVVMKSGKLGALPDDGTYNAGQVVMMEIGRPIIITIQLIGNFGYLDTPLPASAYLPWQYAAAALVLLAVIVGAGINRWRVILVIGGSYAVATLFEMVSVNTSGLIGQGRYLLPMFSGGLLLAAWVIGEWGGLRPKHVTLTNRLALALVVPIHLYSLILVMVRFQQGHPIEPNPHPYHYNPLRGTWHPAVGSVPPLLMLLAGLALIGALVWRSAAGPVEGADGGPASESGPESESGTGSGADPGPEPGGRRGPPRAPAHSDAAS
jgi:hypothetical protein